VPKPSGMRLAILILLFACGSGIAQAYTRAYVVNDTGQTVYTLHVVLANPAEAQSAGSGYPDGVFQVNEVSTDGLTLTFSNPLSASGITSGQTIWIGWSDLNSQLPADIVSYYWTDANGNIVGGIQTPPAGDNGDLSQASNYNLTNSETTSTTTTDSSGGTGGTNGDPGTSGDPSNDPGTGGTTGDPPNGDPLGNQQTATPEPGSASLILGAAFLLWTASNRRRSGQR